MKKLILTALAALSFGGLQAMEQNQLNLNNLDIKMIVLSHAVMLNFCARDNCRPHLNEYSYKIGYALLSYDGKEHAKIQSLSIDTAFRGKGLGKQLAYLTALFITKLYPQISQIHWFSQTLDKTWQSEESLEKFYINLGGKHSSRNFKFDLTKLAGTPFDPQNFKIEILDSGNPDYQLLKLLPIKKSRL